MKLSIYWSPASFNPLQRLAHAFAKANNCAVEKMRYEGNDLILEVSIKRRLGEPMNKNPLMG